MSEAAENIMFVITMFLHVSSCTGESRSAEDPGPGAAAEDEATGFTRL